MRVDPQSAPRGPHGSTDAARAGAEVALRIFGVDAALDRAALQPEGGLIEAQAQARSDSDLFGNQVDAGEGFGHRVFNLDAGIHFQEIVGVALKVDEKLHGARTAITEPLRKVNCGRVQPVSEVRRQSVRGRLLNELLIAALYRAIPLSQVYDAARTVAENLNLDMATVRYETLEVHAGVAKRRARLRGGEFHGGR